MLTRQFTIIATALAATAALTGCSKDNDLNRPDTSAFSNLMTYNGTAGETSTFTYYATNSDVPEIYVSPKVEGLTAADMGKRVALRYHVDDATSISVTTWRLVPTATVSIVDTEEAVANNKPINVKSIDRQGPYLNLYAMLPGEGSHTYTLLCDRETAYTANPQLYLSITESDEPSGIRLSTLSCYDMSQIWNSGMTQSVTVHINNSASTGAQKVFTFKK
ncbi:MAG: hypothetical protein K2K79_04850 [Paramuribaculum sp.]|nr:hypothetical protein [Paramuribaculum sp.]